MEQTCRSVATETYWRLIFCLFVEHMIPESRLFTSHDLSNLRQ
jgi:hypothetical protein